MPLTVTSRIDVVGKLGNSHLKPRLNCGHDLLVTLRRYEGYRETFCTETTSTSTIVVSLLECRREGTEDIPNSVQITVSIWWAVIVDDDVHTFNIDPTPKDVCRN
jgi:hypothetical protein